MNRFIALYRGINVGGRNSVKMEALRAMHERLGHADVSSYIQSGNVVFAGSGTAETITRKTAARFVEDFGFFSHIIVLPAARWSSLVRDNPFSEAAAELPKTVHAGICTGIPSAKGLKALQEKTGGSERFAIKDNVVYLHAPDGFGTSKFAAAMERASGVPITARNWSTVEAIWKMVDEGAD
jgi:uncharacterized protein (DUF1697 family)